MTESDQPESNQEECIQPANVVASWCLARESSGLSLEDVCKRTHIPVRKLEAMECGDFSELGSQTFAAGYIRNYAKIIGQDPEAYVAVYYQSIGGAPDPSAAVMPSQSEKALLGSASKKKLPILPISAAVIGIWIVVMILMPSDRGADSSTTEGLEDTVLTPTPAKMEDLIVTATPMPVGEMPLQNVSSKGGVSDVANSESSEISDAEEASTEVESALLESSTSASDESAEVIQASANESLSSATGIEDVQASTPAEGDDILIFSFSEECWLEVRDGEGKVLIAQLKGKGDNLRLFGQGPFQVMMGNARAVTLTINGQAVSTQPLGGNKTRKMTVTSP